MKTEHFKIAAGQEILSCSVDFSDTYKKPSVISLHGGGPSSKRSTEYIGRALQQAGLSVIRFDYSGQGESSGDITNSSLEKRFYETEAVLNYFQVDSELIIIGTSMGGYTASRIVHSHPVSHLLLFGAAAYSRFAWKLAFGNGFTEEIRRPYSYLDSDLHELLNDFTGKSYFFIGELDEVIPDEVAKMYQSALSNSSLYKEEIIKECPHPIHRWIKKHPEKQKELLSRIIDFIS